MMDLEQALRVLYLKQGATFRQVSEARDDLLDLWDPERLSHHPRLRTKSPRKLLEIDAAYKVVMESLDQAGGRPGKAQGPGLSADASASSGPESSPRRGLRASLYEEVFSRRKKERNRQIPVWTIVGVVLAIVVALVLFQWSRSNGDPPDFGIENSEAVPGSMPFKEGPELSLTATESAVNEERTEEDSETGAKPEIRAVALPPSPSAKAEAKPLPARPQPVTRHATKSPTPVPAAPQRRVKKPWPGGSRRPALRREGPSPAQSDPVELDPTEDKKRRAEQYERVFRDLLASAPAARKLVDEKFAELRFSKWNVVDETGSEIWIELVALQPDGSSVHFTWAINSANGTTRALSAAARRLERTGRAN